MRHAVSGPVADFVTSSAGSTPRQPFPAEAAFDSARGRVRYEWRFRGRWNSLSLWHEGRPAPLADCSLEQFIAEHYWGYCAQRDGGTVEYRVVHPPWQVWRGIDAAIDCDIAALYGPQFVSALSRPPASALLADGSEVAVLRPTRIA